MNSQLLVKLAGFGIIIGAVTVKLPQILKIRQKHSVFGLPVTSIILQLLIYILALSHSIHRGNPFSLYGQNLFLALQMLIILAMFPKYSPESQRRRLQLIFMAMLTLFVMCWMPWMLPEEMIDNAMTLQIPLVLCSRWTQIVENYVNKSVGVLSLITCLLMTSGCYIRLMTAVVQAPEDYKLQASLGIAAMLNTVVMIQFWIYRKKQKKQKKL